MITLNNKIFNAMLNLMMKEYNFYYEFLLQCIIIQDDRCPTMGIQATIKGFEIIYSSKFIDSLSENQLCFVLIHEIMHGLSKHHSRTGDRDKMVCNIAEDMIINTNIENYFDKKIIEKPREIELAVPKEFKEKQVFEILYDWLFKNNKIKTVSLSIGTTDEHLEDQIPEELKDAMVNSFIEQQKAKGNVTNDIEEMLGKLKPKKNTYLAHIKRHISNIIGKHKKNTWKKISRRIDDSEGLFMKGNKRQKQKINIGLDTSGSMNGYFKKVLQYVINNNLECNLIQCDTEIKSVNTVTTVKEVQRIKIKGLGGTILQPILNIVADKYNEYPLILLTDGYCETLDASKIKKDILVLTTEDKINFINAKCRIKQIVLPKEDNERG